MNINNGRDLRDEPERYPLFMGEGSCYIFMGNILIENTFLWSHKEQKKTLYLENSNLFHIKSIVIIGWYLLIINIIRIKYVIFATLIKICTV